MKYTETLTLDISGAGKIPAFHTKQNDKKSRFVECSIEAGSLEFQIPTGTMANVAFRKPDGKNVLNSAKIENNKVIFELTQQMLICPGVASCELQLLDADSVLSTAVFVVIVEPSACDLREVESTPEYKTLLEALQSVAAVKAELELMVDTVNEAYAKIPGMQAAISTAIEQMQEATDRTNKELSSLIHTAQGSTVTLENVLDGSRLKDLTLYGKTSESLFEPIANEVVKKYPNGASIQTVDKRKSLIYNVETILGTKNKLFLNCFKENTAYSFSLTAKWVSKSNEAVSNMSVGIRYKNESASKSMYDFTALDTTFKTKTFTSDPLKTVEYIFISFSDSGSKYAIPLDGFQITPSIEKSPDALTEIHGIENPSVVVSGGNLLNITATSQTVNGVTFTINADKSITVNGTATDVASFPICRLSKNVLSNIVTLSSGHTTEKVSFTTTGLLPNGTTNYNIFNLRAGDVQKTGVIGSQYQSAEISLYVSPKASVNDTFYPVLNYGEKAIPYEPYSAQTYTYPDVTLYSLPNGVRDEINWVDGVFSKFVETETIISGDGFETGTLTKRRYFGKRLQHPGLSKTAIISTHFSSNFDYSQDETAPPCIYIAATGNTHMYFSFPLNTEIDTIAKLDTWLKSQNSAGKPVKILYQLAEPITTALEPFDILTYSPTTNITAPNTIEVAYSKSIASVAQELTDASNKVLSDANTAVANANNAATKANTAAARAEAAADGLKVEQIEQNTADIQDTQDYIGYTKEDIYGLEVDFTNNKFTRLAGAVGKNGGADFNSVECFGGRKRCIVTDSGEILAYHGDAGYTETGALTQAITKGSTTYPVGTMVQVMVFQPKFYYKVVPVKLEKIENGIGYHGRKMRYYLTTTPKEGFRLHPAFISDGAERPYILYSAYEGSLYDTSAKAYIKDDAQVADFGADQLSSIAGAKPVSGLTQLLTRRNGARLAENRGKGWHQQYCATVSATQMLFLIEYASFNMQSKIGAGVTGKTSGTGNEAENTGATSGLINQTGSVSNGCISYRGEENSFGNIYKYVDGMNINARGVHELFISDFDFADDRINSNYKNSGITLAKTNGYVSAFGYNDPFDWLFLASETFGTSTFPTGDHFWQNNTYNGIMIPLLGGSWVNGVNAGGFCWNANSVSSNHSRDVGTRLVYIPKVNTVKIDPQADFIKQLEQRIAALEAAAAVNNEG